MENDFFWIGGKHAVLSASKNEKRELGEIYLTNENNKINFSGKEKIQIKNKSFIDKIFNDPNFNHQGFAALVKKNENPKLELLLKESNNEPLVFLILNELQDDRNIGSIIRSAVAFGANGIIMNKRHFRSKSHEMFKTASGAMEHVAICLVSNLNNAIKILKENNVWVYAMDSDSKKDIFDYNFNNRSAFVFGSEGSGISDLVKKNCDEVIKIGISKNMESLNVSNAVSSVLSIYNYKQKKTA